MNPSRISSVPQAIGHYNNLFPADAFSCILNQQALQALEKSDLDALVTIVKSGHSLSSMRPAIEGKFGKLLLDILMRLAESEDFEKLALELVKAGAALTKMNGDDETALHICMKQHKLVLFNLIFKESLKNDSINDLLSAADSKERPPLFHMRSYDDIICLSCNHTETPLALLPKAIMYGCPDALLTRFIEHQTKEALSQQDSQGICPLLAACCAKRELIACQILDKGVSDQVSSEGSCLQAAILNGLWNVVEMLVPDATPETIHARNANGKTALIYSCQQNREDILLDLLDKIHGTYFDVAEVFRAAKDVCGITIISRLASIALTSESSLFGEDSIGISIYKIACKHGKEELALTIAEKAKGKKLTHNEYERMFNAARDAKNTKLLEMFVALCPSHILANCDLKIEDNIEHPQLGLACIMSACQLDAKELAFSLLDKDIFSNLMGVHTHSIIELIKNATLKGWDDIVEKLIVALPASFILLQDPDGRSPLYLACLIGHEKLALLFLEKGAKDEHSKKLGSSLAQAILQNLNAVAIKLIDQASADLLANEDDKGETVLDIACKMKNEPIALKIILKLKDKCIRPARLFTEALKNNLSLVLEKLIDIPLVFFLNTAFEGKTMLFLACEYGRTDLALRILKRGAKDRASAHGTALMIAIKNRLQEVIDALINESDAKAMHGTDSEDRGPLFMCCLSGDEDLALKLLAKGAKDRPTKTGSSALTICIEKGLAKVLTKLEEQLASKSTASAYRGKHLAYQVIECVKNNREDIAFKLLQNVKLEMCDGLEKALVQVLKKDPKSELSLYLLSHVATHTMLATFTQLCQEKEKALALTLVEYGVKAHFNNVTEPLCVAIKQNLDEVAEAMIASYPVECFTHAVKATDSPLYQAFASNKDTLARKLLDKGMKNWLPQGNELLAMCFENCKDQALIERLVAATSNDNITCSSNSLVTACIQGNEKAALQLIERGAKDSVTDLGTALMAALRSRLNQAAERLTLVATEEIINFKNAEDSATALSIALQNSWSSIAQTLLDKGSKDIYGSFGKVLYHALRSGVEDELLTRLLKASSPRSLLQAFNYASKTHEDSALYLFDKINEIVTIPFSRAAISCTLVRAIYFEFPRLSKKLLLLAKSDSLNTEVSGEVEKTPLITAIKKSNVGVTIDLLERGAKNYSEDKAGNSPLHLACMYGHYSIVLKMLELKAIQNINSINTDKRTPFSYLLTHSHDSKDLEEAIYTMLKAGARISLYALKEVNLSQAALRGIKRYLKELLLDFPTLHTLLDSHEDYLPVVIDALFNQNLEALIKQHKEKNLAPPIKIALLLGDKELLEKMAVHTEVGDFFNLLRTDFLEENSSEFRSLVLSIFRENTASRKKGVIVAKFPEAPRRIYLFRLPNYAKIYLPDDASKAANIARLVKNIRENVHITATPVDALKRKAFYSEVATGLKHVTSQLEKEANSEKWKLFLEDVASAGAACGIRYEQMANEQFISHCLGMGAAKPEDKVYNSLSLLRYRLLQACAELRLGGREGLQQDSHLVRDLLQGLAEDLGIACHEVNKTVTDKYSLLPNNEENRKVKLDEYKKKFNDAYTLENICDNFLLYPDYQQDCTSYLIDNPPDYWTNAEINKVLQTVAKLSAEKKSDDEIKEAVSEMGYPYPPSWPLAKMIQQIRFDTWAEGYTDSNGKNHSYLYEVKELKEIDSSSSQSLRFVTVLEVLYALSVAESALKKMQSS